MTITAILIAKNEQENIIPCIKSLDWCTEILLIDDESTDKTVSLAVSQNPAIKVFKRKSGDNFSDQRNYTLDKAKSDWIIFIDCDERVSQPLAKEIKEKIRNASNCQGYYLRRRDYFGERFLKFGETGDINLLRIGRKNSGHWEGIVHENWHIVGHKEALSTPLDHYPHQTIREYLNKINFYTDRLIIQWKKDKRKIYSWEIIIYPLGKFIFNYFLRLGILDGVPGLIYAIMMSFHSFLVRSKYYLTQNKQALS